MPLTKERKADVVAEVAGLLDSSKMVVIARYSGTPVKALQELRRGAKESGTQLQIIKNRLFKKALADNPKLKDIDVSILVGQLMYGFNAEDEIAPAQSLAQFARTNPQIEFVGAISDSGQFLSAEEVNVLANLPSKDQLRGQLIATISAPQTGLVNVLAGNIRGILNVLNSRAQALEG